LSQMDLVNNSISALDNHICVIEGMDLDMTVLRTLRASGHALKHMSIPGGSNTVDEIMMGVEEQINEASDMAKAVSSGALTSGDDEIDPMQLMYELELVEAPATVLVQTVNSQFQGDKETTESTPRFKQTLNEIDENSVVDTVKIPESV
jgi:hypothetical protein